MSRLKIFGREHRGLLAMNAVLLLQAQNQRPRGQYSLIAARALGFSESAIYIVDAANGDMMVMRYDRSNKQLKFLGFRSLTADARELKNSPEFSEKKHEILNMIWEMEEQIMGTGV